MRDECIRETVGQVYSAMSDTTDAAAAVCQHITRPNVQRLERALADTMRRVEALHVVVELSERQFVQRGCR